MPGPTGGAPRGAFSRELLALIVGQVGLHACMAGVRVAVPLEALRQGRAEGSVGVLLALFALAPVALAVPAGRMADRVGYHRPIAIAVASAFAGAAIATLSTHFLALCIAATLTGAGANIGLITIQRTAGRMTDDATERMQVFSWLGLAPALSNVVGPLVAGVLIDTAGFAAAFGTLMLLPLAALISSRAVPRETPAAALAAASGGGRRIFDLLRLPPLRWLLVVNWLIAASWELHSFVLPVLGHQRGLSASAIGSILAVFAGAVAAVRLLIPLLAHRLHERQVLVGAMLATAAVFAVYPWAPGALTMAACAAVLGLVLGGVQPMVMSTLHQLAPVDRHGEAIALRSMTINLSSTLMPLAFGAVGTALGAGALFWIMGLAVALGSRRVHRIAG